MNFCTDIDRPKVFNNNVDAKTKAEIEQSLGAWAEAESKKDQRAKGTAIFEPETKPDASLGMSQDDRQRNAEREKNKGNEAVKSGVTLMG